MAVVLTVWGRAFLFLGAWAGLVVVPVHLFGEADWVWPAATAGLAAYLAYHLQHIARLMRWVHAPIDTPVPDGRGLWDDLFAALHRRARTRAEQQNALALALERFQQAAEALPDGIVLCDRHGRIEWFNPCAQTHFHLQGERDRGQRLTNLVRDPGFADYLHERRYAEPYTYRAAAEGRTLLMQVVPYGADQVLLMSRDVSHVERLETMRRDFVANVSHELKTPLTVVAGFAETLLDHYEGIGAEEARSYLGLIHEQAARMRRLIEDLLTLAALETDGGGRHDEEVAVAPLLETILAEAEVLSAGRHRVQLHMQGPRALCGSATELRSAFSNLVTNAIRYTPDGGEVRVVWTADDHGGASLSVRDSGIGIAAEHLPRLTERFYRVDHGRSREKGGTGLGLAIVKHVLHRHGGVLQIASTVGHGSAFTACFPSSVVLP